MTCRRNATAHYTYIHPLTYNTHLMTRQILTSIKVDRSLSEELGIIAAADNRTKLDELRFLIKERKKVLKKNGGLYYDE